MDLVVVVQDYILRILEEAGPGMKVSFLIGCGLWVLKIPGNRIRLRLNKFKSSKFDTVPISLTSRAVKSTVPHNLLKYLRNASFHI